MFQDFVGITNNEAYRRVFVDRMMLPYPGEQGRYLGNTQREDFLPFLLRLIEKLPDHAEIFDFGCGSGETVDLALRFAHSAQLNFEEPNPLLLEKYIERVNHYNNLKMGSVFSCRVEDFYHGKASSRPTPPPPNSQDLILDLHMIYHLTSFEGDSSSPEQNIFDLLSFQYQCLKPGGSIFLVYADDEQSTTSKASRYYFEKVRRYDSLQRMLRISQARTHLLKNMGIVKMLRDAYPASSLHANVDLASSWVFGQQRRDMAILCLIGELGAVDDEEFDVKKLEICFEFTERHGQDIHLSIENRDIAQKGMWRFYQPQVLLTITKEC